MDALDAAIDKSHRALEAIIQGDPEPFVELYSDEDDATLANPWGPPRRGIKDIGAGLEAAAANYRDGEIVRFERVTENVTPELAYILEIERFRTTVIGNDEVTDVALRVTSIFRLEGDKWKLVHRHADPITTARGPEWIAQQQGPG